MHMLFYLLGLFASIFITWKVYSLITGVVSWVISAIVTVLTGIICLNLLAGTDE